METHELRAATSLASSRDQWLLYMPVLLLSVAIMLSAIIVAERYRRMKSALVAAVSSAAGSTRRPARALFLFTTGSVCDRGHAAACSRIRGLKLLI